jgi:hypothetical protein
VRREILTRIVGLIATSFLIIASGALQSSQPEVLERVGSCPSGYRSSGSYCVPGSNAPQAILKVGNSCPASWRSSGKYCVTSDYERMAVKKVGNSCPPGWRSSSLYCIK